MIRTFCTNRIRRTEELSSSLWQFTPTSGEHEGETYPVFVPGCWENLPEFSAWRGVGRYVRHFSGGGNIRLVFKGVSHTAVVKLDGREIGRHYNAFTPFDIAVENLPQGDHELTVLADNRFSEDSALHVPNDYMTYGGITRGVVLESLKDACIEYIHAVPVKCADGWHVRTETRVKYFDKAVSGLELQVTVEGCGTVLETIEANEEGTAVFRKEFAAREDISEWSPENPALYKVSAVLLCGGEPFDDLIDRFGYREIRTDGKDILLNGRKLRIKGFCRHEDHPMYGCALPPAAIEQDIQIAADLGANAIRTSHYPNDEIFLDLCDEQGILVWEENHARGLSEEQMRNPNFERQAEDCIREMITAHMNHPSILIWGILNECASDTEYGFECYKKQYELIAAMDASRPRSSASCRFRTDICLGLPDIVSYNIYPQWYHDTPAAEYLRDLYNWIQTNTEGAGKPFLVTEIGAGAIYGYRTPAMSKWSEEYQREALRGQIKAVLGQEGCSGIFIWQLTDVRISAEWFASRPRTMNNKGIVDEYRRRKLAYDTVKELYHSYSNYR